jgi:hypothetical protein
VVQPSLCMWASHMRQDPHLCDTFEPGSDWNASSLQVSEAWSKPNPALP